MDLVLYMNVNECLCVEMFVVKWYILELNEEAQNKWKEKKNYKIYGVDYFIGSNVKLNDYQAMFCW